MNRPLVCMTLTGSTIEENLQLVKKYEKMVDLLELRVDFLSEDEQLYARRFPSLIKHPCILTIRRDVDGGKFNGGEFARTTLFARALSFAHQNKSRNFAYVDFEDDFHIPSIQDAALAFGVKIIRSVHSMNEPILNLKERCDALRRTGYEIPKIAFSVSRLSDVANLFYEGAQLIDYEHILCALGLEGFPSRILSSISNSYLTYTSPTETLENTQNLGHIDPITLNTIYNFKNITKNTNLYGITGWPLEYDLNSNIHNSGYRTMNLDSVYFPIRSSLVSESLAFAKKLEMKGLSISVPHNESVLFYLDEQTEDVKQIGSCNTVLRQNNKWVGYNTDAIGFRRALLEFLDKEKIKRRKVAVIGSGGAAKAIVYVLKQLGAKVCIFNRTLSHAKQLAEKYGFEYSELDPSCVELLSEYSSLIIQTTSVGMSGSVSQELMDPIYFYNFKGHESLFELICKPATTPVMRRASLAGCKVCNGYTMLEYQAYEQYKLFTGRDYEHN